MPDEQPPKPDSQPQPRAERASAHVERLIRQHGSAEAALAVLSGQLVTYEEQSATDRRRITELEGKVPTGAVVLPKERVEALNAFEALKLSAEQVQKLVTENTELTGKVKAHDVTDLARKGAPNLGYDPEAVATLVSRNGLHLELREVEVEVETNGKKDKVKRAMPFVRPAADEKAPLQSLADYAKTLPAFEQRALVATAPGAQQTTATAAGPTWPAETPTQNGGTRPTDAVGEHIRKQNEAAKAKPHPFIPRPAAAPAAATP